MQNRVPAGFFSRFFAYILDRLILVIGMGFFRGIGGIVNLFTGGRVLNRAVIFKATVSDIIAYVIISAYFIILTYSEGRTLGKKALRIHVESVESRKPTLFEVIIRETVGRYLSGILFIGYLMAAVNSSKRGLHDLIADTVVVCDTPKGRDYNSYAGDNTYETSYTEVKDESIDYENSDGNEECCSKKAYYSFDPNTQSGEYTQKKVNGTHDEENRF